MEVKLTKDNFEEEVINSSIPVVVDFWAEWCMPCKMVAPVLEELDRDYDGKVKFAKLNVDEQNDLATRYNVVSIPTLFVFHKGKVVKQQVGAVPRAKIEELFSDLV